MSDEARVSVSPEYLCFRCPRRFKASDTVYPDTDLVSCPVDSTISQIGTNTTVTELREAIKQYHLEYTGHRGWDMRDGEYVKLFQYRCPHGEGNLPGGVLVDTVV